MRNLNVPNLKQKIQEFVDKKFSTCVTPAQEVKEENDAKGAEGEDDRQFFAIGEEDRDRKCGQKSRGARHSSHSRRRCWTVYADLHGGRGGKSEAAVEHAWLQGQAACIQDLAGAAGVAVQAAWLTSFWIKLFGRRAQPIENGFAVGEWLVRTVCLSKHTPDIRGYTWPRVWGIRLLYRPWALSRPPRAKILLASSLVALRSH